MDKIRLIFYKFDALAFCQNNKGKFDRAQVKHLVEDLLDTLEAFHNNGKVNWAELFFGRLEVDHNLISHGKIALWSDVMNYYLNHYCKRISSSTPKYNFLISLIKYLDSHENDPENSLVGHRVNLNIIATYYSKSSDGYYYKKKEGNASYVGELIDCKKKQRLKVSNGKSRIGNFVIWFTSNKPIFARIAAVVDDSSLSIFVDPLEKENRVVASADVQSLHKDLLSFFGIPKLMQKMVSDSIDSFFSLTISKVKIQTLEFLKERGVNTNLLLSILHLDGIEKKVSIFDLLEINKVKQKLVLWQENPPLKYFRNIDTNCRLDLSQFLLDPTNKFFLPTLDKSLQNLKAFKFHTIAYNRIRRYSGSCDNALDFLMIEKKLLMNGTKKKNLMEWWLSYVDTSSRKFLRDLGYDFFAVPIDYIQIPPQDIEPVKYNLRILTEILDKSNDVHQVLSFIKTISDEIYLNIQEFEDKAIIVLSEHFGVDPEVFDLKLSQELHQDALVDKKDSDVVVKWVDDMMKDIEYLRTMKEMENKVDKGGKVKLSNVVPISGLILSSFFRKENEMKTVLELWDKPVSPTTKKNSSLDRIKMEMKLNGPKRECNMITAELRTGSCGLVIEKGELPKSKSKPLITQIIESDTQESWRKNGNLAGVNSYLFLGDWYNANDFKFLKRNGITHILNCTLEVPNYYPGKFSYCKLEIDDLEEEDLLQLLPMINNFINSARNVGGIVFVHCRYGISRSTTALLCYMISNLKMSLKSAFEDVYAVRKIINPNPGFWNQLLQLERSIHGENSIDENDIKFYQVRSVHPTEDEAKLRRLIHEIENLETILDMLSE